MTIPSTHPYSGTSRNATDFGAWPPGCVRGLGARRIRIAVTITCLANPRLGARSASRPQLPTLDNNVPYWGFVTRVADRRTLTTDCRRFRHGGLSRLHASERRLPSRLPGDVAIVRRARDFELPADLADAERVVLPQLFRHDNLGVGVGQSRASSEAATRSRSG